MLQLLAYVLFASLQIIGIYVAFRDGAPLSFVRIFLMNVSYKLPIQVWHPIFNCITCMGGLWSYLIFSFEFSLPFFLSFKLMCAVIGLNYILSATIDHFMFSAIINKPTDNA